jgi:Flp pilus assembly protein TadG
MALTRFSQDEFTCHLAAAREMSAKGQPLVTDMLGTSIIRSIRKAASRFVRADRGNIAVMFAIVCVPLISFVGAAVDYSRLNAARSAMQSALDSTALMVSKDLTSGVITSNQIGDTAQKYFSALYTGKDATVNPISAAYTASSGSTTSTVVVTGSGSIVTEFMRVAGFPTLNFGTSSTATWGNTRMRVAMVLDNTGSIGLNGRPSLPISLSTAIPAIGARPRPDRTARSRAAVTALPARTVQRL